MHIKYLLSGLPNTGKTTLLKSLNPETTLIIARDGKAFPFRIPHRTITDFVDTTDLINQIAEAIETFTKKFKCPPKTIVLDTISKVLLDIESKVVSKVTSFPYSVVNKQISELMTFIENEIAPNCNFVFVSHAIYNSDTERFELVNAGGAWGKKGGMLSEVDNAGYVEVRGKNRYYHHKSSKFAARTTLNNIEDCVSLDKFNLQEHLDLLKKSFEDIDDYMI